MSELIFKQRLGEVKAMEEEIDKYKAIAAGLATKRKAIVDSMIELFPFKRDDLILNNKTNTIFVIDNVSVDDRYCDSDRIYFSVGVTCPDKDGDFRHRIIQHYHIGESDWIFIKTRVRDNAY